MATVKSLEDMLSSEVDESAVSALVGSLESQLASSTTPLPSQDGNATSGTVNHVNNAVLVDNNVVRLLDGQKQGLITVSQAVSLLNASKSANASSKIVGESNSSPAATTTASSTLPGALPASGYITQVTASPLLRSQDGSKAGSPTKLPCTINTRSKTAAAAAAMPNGGSPPIVAVKSSPSPMGAIYDLATVASQQAPIATCVTTTCAPQPQQVQVAIANGKQDTSKVQPLTTTVVQVSGNPKPQVVTASQPIQVVTNPSLLTTSHGVQIVNRLAVQGLGQKTLAPRVVLNPVRIAAAPQILTARAGVAGQRFTAPNNAQIKVQTISPQQPQRIIAPRNQVAGQKIVQNSGKGTITLPPNMVRTAVLLKSENGQYQVLNISGAPGAALPGTAYRLSSVPAGTATVRTVTPQQITVPALKTNQAAVTVPQTIVNTILQPLSNANTVLSTPNTTKNSVIKAGVNGTVTTPLTIQTTTANTQPSTPTQMSPNTAKKKCKNFLSTLIRLADEQPTTVAKSVRNLIQGIIDGTIQAEEFTTKLQRELNSAPQPYLVPFLKKNLPYLRHSLITKELTIEGVRPPPPSAMTLPHPNLQPVQINQQKRPLITPTTQVRIMTATSTPIATQLLQTNQTLINQRFSATRLPTSTPAKSLLVGKTFVASSVAANSPATVTTLQSKLTTVQRNNAGKFAVWNSVKDAGKRSFSALREDDDINDVAAMGGVNLIEESQKILASNSELVGTQIRSCKDETFLYSSALQRRIHAVAKKHGLEEVSPEVVNLVSHASQQRLKNLIEKLSVIAEHRVENPKVDSRFEVLQDVKGQLKFIDELDRLEKRRHEEQEREILLRAAKSRSKLEDPEQLKLKQKAKEMQKAELEDLRQREANATALLAIGPRKKAKLESVATVSQTPSSPYSGANSNSSKFQSRPRVKRVNVRDLLYLMEQERESVRKPLLYKSYLK